MADIENAADNPKQGLSKTRLPSFNDFSPEILKGDIKACLQAVVDGKGDDKKVIGRWVKEYFGGSENKRSSTNIPATLRSTGMTTGERPMVLSEVGERVRAAPDKLEAARIFCAHLLTNKNGHLLLEALSALRQRQVPVRKLSLKNELTARGVTGLSTNTTDHTTFKNWLVAAGLVTATGHPIDSEVKKALGISVGESDEFKSMSLGQQVFLELLRREHETRPGPFLGADLLRECLSTHPHLFDEGQFAKKIREPLRSAGWIDVEALAKGRQGGKSGRIRGAAKLLAIPISALVPDFDQVVPSGLRQRLNTPLNEISVDLFGANKHRAGIALELLALRMIMDLGLQPRHFRLRSADSAFAEVDLIAEGAHLMFSRWTFQCKRFDRRETSKVGLSDVAKEVGIAIFAKAHVIVLVTTSSFSRDAVNYAREVARATPLQFMFMDGKVVDAYLKKGKGTLLEHFQTTAKEVMLNKREQPLPTGVDS